MDGVWQRSASIFMVAMHLLHDSTSLNTCLPIRSAFLMIMVDVWMSIVGSRERDAMNAVYTTARVQ